MVRQAELTVSRLDGLALTPAAEYARCQAKATLAMAYMVLAEYPVLTDAEAEAARDADRGAVLVA